MKNCLTLDERRVTARIKMVKLINIFSQLFIIFILNFRACKATPNLHACETLTNSDRTIAYTGHGNYFGHQTQKCWLKKVPENSVLILKFGTLTISSDGDCLNNYIDVSEWNHGDITKNHRYCKNEFDYNSGVPGTSIPDPFVAFHDVIISAVNRESTVDFHLKLTRESLTCRLKEAFHCLNDICIPNEKVCDGIRDCSNGLDERNCANRILSVEGIETRRSSAFNWLEKQSDSSALKHNLHRSIVALHLSGNTNFSNRDYTSKNSFLAKQLELDTTVSLLRNSTDPVSSNELSMLLNALLVTCQNPRQFYGFNLVQLLKDQVTYSDDTVQPAAYLALCNAHEPLPKSSIDQLLQVLNKDSDYPFMPALQAIAVMTISCLLKNGQGTSFNDTDLEVYKTSVIKLKGLQQEDGSFGNVHTTALITQALISKGEEDSKDWNMKAGIKFLMEHLSRTLDYLSIFYILPILNTKSLADIASVNCTGSGKENEEKAVLNLMYKIGQKMQVQYSLYLGTNKDVIHTIYLSVPEKISAYEVMQLAALEDPKYKFQSKSISGKIYVFAINDYFDDPVAGLFWLKYIEGERFNDTLVHCKTSVDEIELQENDHLIMWYKRPHF